MTLLIEMSIKGPGLSAIFASRDAGKRPDVANQVQQVISIVAFVGNDIVGLASCAQSRCLGDWGLFYHGGGSTFS